MVVEAVDLSMDLSTKVPFGFWYNLLSDGRLHFETAFRLYQINLQFRELIQELINSKRIYQNNTYVIGIPNISKEFRSKIKYFTYFDQINFYLTDDGNIYYNFEGSDLIKLEGVVKVKALFSKSHILTEDNKLYEIELGEIVPGEIEISLELIKFEEGKIKKITFGEDNSLILTEEGNIYSNGTESVGQLGLGLPVGAIIVTPQLIRFEGMGKVKDISSGKQFSLILTEDGDVYSFGDNLGQFGLDGIEYKNIPTLIGPKNIKFKGIETGDYHALLLTESGNVYSFGDDIKNELGLGYESEEKIEPILVDIPGKKKITAISADRDQSLFLTEGGNVYSAGQGYLRRQDNALMNPEIMKLTDLPTLEEDLKIRLQQEEVLSIIVTGIYFIIKTRQYL